MRSPLLPVLSGALLLLASVANAASTGVTGGGAPVENRQPSLVMNQVVPLSGLFPCRNCSDESAEHTMGFVRTFAEPFGPFGTPSANGQLMSIASNTALFSLLGTTYGGNGMNTFALPDLRGRAVVGAGTGPGLSTYDLGQQSGAAQNILTVGNLAAHDHGAPGGATGITGASDPFDNRQPSLGMNFMIAATPRTGPGSDPFVGQIGQFAGDFAPGGWLAADGSLVNIADHPDLFTKIGTIYGGDGATTFGLPDLRGRLAVGAGAGISAGDTFGQEQTVLAEANLPAHVHSLPGGGFTDPEGGGAPFDNAQPSLAINYLIDVAGIFPNRDGGGGLFTDGEPILGEIVGYAGIDQPSGWMFADGRLLSIASNTALFELLGTTYGGDGMSTFALPDLRGRTILGADPANGYDFGATFGERLTTLTVDQLAPHDHTLPSAGGVPEPGVWTLTILGFGMMGAMLRRRRPAYAEV